MEENAELHDPSSDDVYIVNQDVNLLGNQICQVY